MSHIQPIGESDDSDDPAMASGFLTPPKRQEDVIAVKQKDIKDELEAYLQHQAKGPSDIKIDQESDQIVQEYRKNSSFSGEDKDKSEVIFQSKERQ